MKALPDNLVAGLIAGGRSTLTYDDIRDGEQLVTMVNEWHTRTFPWWNMVTLENCLEVTPVCITSRLAVFSTASGLYRQAGLHQALPDT